MELKPLSSSVLEPLCLLLVLVLMLLMAVWLAVVAVLLSSSVSTLEEEDAVEEMVECTELSVELRSDSLESRILLARRKISSALDFAAGEGASRVAFMMLVELCNGGVSSVITELVFPCRGDGLPKAARRTWRPASDAAA